MTREELEELGLTDAALERLVKTEVGADVSLSGEDTAAIQARRRSAFDQSMARASGATHTNPSGPRMSTFALDAPTVHREVSGNVQS